MSDRRQLKQLLAIDWDARTLRVVHAFLSKRGLKIDRVLSVALPADVDPRNSQQLGLHIQRVLEHEEIRTRHAVVDIPRDQATLNSLTLPAAGAEELPGMVEIQIAKELPFAVSDAVVDFVAGPRGSDRTTVDVQVAAVRREALDHYEATFFAAGLRLERIGLRPFANMVAVRALLKHAMPDRVMFIDVGPALTEIDVLKHSVLVFSRAASVQIPRGLGEGMGLSIVRDDGAAGVGGGSPQSAEPRVSLPAQTERTVDMLLLEVTRSIEAYRASEPGAVIDHVVIGGDLGIEDALVEAIQQRLNVTAEIYNPASTFGWEPDEGAAAPAFAATLGLVLGQLEDSSLHFDFLHPKRPVSAAERRLKKVPVAATVAILFIAAGAIGVAEMTRPERQRLAGIESRIEALKENVSSNRDFLRLVDELREFDEDHLIWVDVLYDAASMLPSHEEMILTHLDMDQKDHRLVLKTRVKTRETATGAVAKLNEFRRPGADRPRFRTDMGTQTVKEGELYPFEQTLRIEVLDDGVGWDASIRLNGAKSD